ncbi:hypothetical protein BGZ54_007091 [Gamsiella multidivaricata]|nr:hypothetical protein BGZ54_007091 [Gamsiella multidivaricata]
MWYPEQEGTRVPSSDSSLLISSDHPSKGFTVHQHIPQEYSTHSDAESMHDSRIEGDQLAALGFSICPSMAPTESSEETPQSTPTAVSVQPSHTPATSAPSKRSFQHPPDPPSISPSQHNIILPFQTANSSSTFSHSSSLIDPDANIPRLTSKPGSSPVLRPESVSETPGVTPGGTTSLNQAPSLIARISIPESHRKLFVETLSRPPDPALKVKKKSVRFKAALSGSTASVAASKVLRSNQESPVATSTTRLPSSISPKSGSSRPLCSSSPIAHHTSKLYGLPVMDSRDPDEKMAELMELKQVK